MLSPLKRYRTPLTRHEITDESSEPLYIDLMYLTYDIQPGKLTYRQRIYRAYESLSLIKDDRYTMRSDGLVRADIFHRADVCIVDHRKYKVLKYIIHKYVKPEEVYEHLLEGRLCLPSPTESFLSVCDNHFISCLLGKELPGGKLCQVYPT